MRTVTVTVSESEAAHPVLDDPALKDIWGERIGDNRYCRYCLADLSLVDSGIVAMYVEGDDEPESRFCTFKCLAETAIEIALVVEAETELPHGKFSAPPWEIERSWPV